MDEARKGGAAVDVSGDGRGQRTAAGSARSKRADTDVSLVELMRNAWWALKQTWRISRPLSATLIVTSTLSALVPAPLALVFGLLVSTVKDAVADGQAHLPGIMLWPGLVGGLILLAAVCATVNRYCVRLMSDVLRLEMSLKALGHASTLDLAFFEDPESQDILERATAQPGADFLAFLLAAIQSVTMTVQFISLLVVLLWIAPLVTLVLLALGLPWLWFQWNVSQVKFWTDRSKTSARRWTRYYSNRLTDRDTVPTIKLFNLAPLLLHRFEQTMRQIMNVDRRVYRQQMIGGLVAALLFTLGFLGVVGSVGYQALQGAIAFHLLITYWVVASRFQATMSHLVTACADMVIHALFISNLQELLRTRPLISTVGAQAPQTLRGQIELRHVSFSYPGTERPVIQNLSLRINAGETVALVGPNGAGKTTLVNLIARLYEVDQGAVLFDGYDVRDLSARSLYDRIAYVGQTPIRFEASVTENIAYGDWQRLIAQPQLVREIAAGARLESMIQAMPEGFDTLLGRRFGKYDLSGGQWQKIAVARALARDATLFILDEPTASLDARSEADMFASFRPMAQGRTTILISHRFSTVHMANRIFVIDGGRIVEEGTPEQLLANGGMYAQLYRLHHMSMGQNVTTEPLPHRT